MSDVEGGRAGRRIGVWASDAITAAGMMALLPLVGFEPVMGADPATIDALLVATESGTDEATLMLTAAAEIEGVPVVWLHRRQADGARTVNRPHGVELVCPDELSVQEVGQALLTALLSQLSPISPRRSADRAGQAAVGVRPQDRRRVSDSGLTAIERDVLNALAEGQDTGEIAARLFYSERTVKNAISRAVHKLHAVNRSSAVAAALRRGYL